MEHTIDSSKGPQFGELDVLRGMSASLVILFHILFLPGFNGKLFIWTKIVGKFDAAGPQFCALFLFLSILIIEYYSSSPFILAQLLLLPPSLPRHAILQSSNQGFDSVNDFTGNIRHLLILPQGL